MRAYKNLIISIIIGLSTLGAETIDILYNTTEDMGGFQFLVSGVTVLSAELGDNVPSDWMVSSSDNGTVLGFSFQGTTIPAGIGVLTILEVEGLADDACLVEDSVCGASGINPCLVISDGVGQSMDVELIDCLTISQLAEPVPGCTDDAACNYDSGATEDDGSCDYGAECWDGSFECDEANCPDIPTSTIDILYSTTDDISGFQFAVTGVTVLSASGGAAGAAGFMVSASATTVIGFSLSGATIPAGSGVLVHVDIEGVAEDACLDAVVLSDAPGLPIDNEIINCLTISQIATISGCTDETACNFNPDANEDDGSCEFDLGCGCFQPGPSGCDNQCGSTAEIDDCGVCNGGNAYDLGCGCFEPGPSGCDNMCGSTAELDECGVCDGSGSEFVCFDGSMVCEENECPEPTEVSGNVGGTWTLDNSPYFVSQNILLQPDDSLTIEPGVQVFMADNARFDIYGTFFAEGTETDSIIFTHSNDYWLSINFADGANDSSILSYCVIEGASNSGFLPYYGAVNANSSSPTITHNSIKHSGHNEDRTSCNGINLSSSNSIVSDNLFEDVVGHGIYIDGTSSPEISGNTFLDIGGYGISMDGVTISSISDNTLTDIELGGINMSNSTVGSISGNTLTDIGSYGIYMSNSTVGSISGNTLTDIGSVGISIDNVSVASISDNVLTGISGNGINFYSSDSTSITANSITAANSRAIYASSSNSLIISDNTLDGNSSEGIYLSGSNYATIFSNTITSNGSYGIYISSGGFITISENSIRENFNSGIYLGSGNYYMDITENEIMENDGAGISVGNNYGGGGNSYGTHIVIVQNTIMGNSSDGIFFSYSDGDFIENLIVDNGSYGLYLYQMTADCEVRNNTIDGHSSDGLYWRSSSQSTYTLTAINNSITNNGAHGINCYNGENYNTIAYNNSYNNTTAAICY